MLGDTLALLGSAILSWIVRHPVWLSLIASSLLYGFRADLMRVRRSAVMPAIRGCAAGGDVFWSRAKLQGKRAIHRWHEITLFSRSDAPSRLVFGLLGVMIVLLSLKLSYEGLIPHLYDTSKGESAAAARDILALLLGASHRNGLMIVLFEAAIGFVALELFGVTGVFRFAMRYPSKLWRGIAGIFLLAVLLGFGIYEAWLGLEANEHRFDSACAEIQMDNPLCENGTAPYSWLFPERNPGGNASFADAMDPPQTVSATSEDGDTDHKKTEALRKAAISRAIVIEHTKAWLDIVFALVMPFVLMVVGLAFDFFEEMYLPLASLVFAIFHLAAAMVLRVLSQIAFVVLWLLGILAKAVMLPAAAAVMLYYALKPRLGGGPWRP